MANEKTPESSVEVETETVNFSIEIGKIGETIEFISQAANNIDDNNPEDLWKRVYDTSVESLSLAKTERSNLLKTIDTHINTLYIFKNGEPASRADLIKEINEIDVFLLSQKNETLNHNVVINNTMSEEEGKLDGDDTGLDKEGKLTQNNSDDRESTVEKKVYESINEEIEKYSKQLDNFVSDNEREEIQSFISRNIDNIDKLLNTDKIKKLNKKSILIKTIKSDLKKLKDLNLKLNAANKTETKPTFNKIDIKEKLPEGVYKVLTENPDFAQFKNSLFSLADQYNQNIDKIDTNERDSIDNKELYEKQKKLKRKIYTIREQFFAFGKAKYLEFKKQEKLKTWTGRFKKHTLASFFKSTDLEILSTNTELQSKALNIFNKYNTEIDRKNFTGSKREAELYTQINDLRNEFEKYKHEHEEKVKKVKNKEKSKKDTADESAQENTSSSKPKSSPEAEPNTSTETTEENIESENIFTIDINEDYTEINNDTGFDKWLTNINKLLNENKVNLFYEKKDIKDWYKEYQDALPYIKKLNTIFEDINSESKTKIEKLGYENKINILIYEIHTKGDSAKKAIDEIYKSYEKSKELEKELENWKKREELKKVIEETENKKGYKPKSVTSKQVQEILEYRGEENAAENLSELTNLLADFHLNYDFYCSGTKEGESNNIHHVYKKYKTVGAKNKTPKKITNWFSKLGKRMFASLPRGVDDYDKYNQFIDITKKVREFDLVDRKNGNAQKTEENKSNMSKLIYFIEDNADILEKYLTDEKSVDVKSAFSDPDDEKLFKKAVDLYKTFTIGKYRTSEAKEKAMNLLEKNESPDLYDGEETIEMLYSSPEEKDLFEKNAEISINREHLLTIEKDIDLLTKSKEKNIEKVETLNNLFKKTQVILEKLGSNEDKEKIKNIEFKLSVLILKNINTDNFNELSKSFTTYEYILSSKDIKKEEKIKYINDLIENLKKLKKAKDDKSNYTVFNAQLDAIIRKYQEKLSSIK